MTRRAGEPADGSRRACASSSTRTRRSCPWSASPGRCTWTRRCGRRSTRTCDGRRLDRASSCAEGRRVVLRRRALLRRLPARPRLRARVPRARPRRPAPSTLVLCDTNGGTLPDDVGADRGEVARARLDAGRRPLPQRRGVRGGELARCAAGAGAPQVQGTINGYGERCGNADLLPIAANLVAQARARAAAGRQPRRLAETATSSPRSRTSARPAPALRRGARVRAQGRAARLGHRPAARRVRARRPAPVGNRTTCWSPTSPAAQRAGQGRGAGRRPARTRRRGPRA